MNIPMNGPFPEGYFGKWEHEERRPDDLPEEMKEASSLNKMDHIEFTSPCLHLHEYYHLALPSTTILIQVTHSKRNLQEAFNEQGCLKCNNNSTTIYKVS